MSLMRSPRRWRQSWPPTSEKPRPKASPPRSSSEADPRSFAASWAAERGIIPAAPSRGNARRRPLVLVAFTALAAIVLIVAALLLLTGQPKATLVATRPEQHDLTCNRHRRPPSYHSVPAGTSSPRKPVRPGRVDPAVLRDRRARLRRMAVVELGPLATTQRPGLATCNPPATKRGTSWWLSVALRGTHPQILTLTATLGGTPRHPAALALPASHGGNTGSNPVCAATPLPALGDAPGSAFDRRARTRRLRRTTP